MNRLPVPLTAEQRRETRMMKRPPYLECGKFHALSSFDRPIIMPRMNVRTKKLDCEDIFDADIGLLKLIWAKTRVARVSPDLQDRWRYWFPKKGLGWFTCPVFGTIRDLIWASDASNLVWRRWR